ncbi:MAG: DUF1178 family protein [Lautropia sp.]|nr:DUF1178 family protein [Lautropia sp.]
MKVFNLCCEREHQFEGWFSSADDFEQQQERQLIECPLCGSHQVRKLLSAPRLNLVHGRSSEAAPVDAPTAKGGDDEGQMREVQARMMQGLRKLIEETEDVGDRFAEEARRIHFNEAPARAIRGTASPEETESLRDEGIEVLTVPLPVALKGTLQ